MRVFYNIHEHSFTLTPVMNSLDFLTLMSQLVPGTQLQTLQDDLGAKLKEVEAVLKENNHG